MGGKEVVVGEQGFQVAADLLVPARARVFLEGFAAVGARQATPTDRWNVPADFTRVNNALGSRCRQGT